MPILRLLLFSFLLAGFLSGCATTPPRLTPPRSDLADPLRGIEISRSENFQRGYQHYLQGNQQKARQEFLQVVEESPDYYPAHLALAYSYLAEGNSQYAESYARKAIEVNADYAQAHFLLSHLLETQQNYQGALNELNEVARIQPDYPSLVQAQNVVRLKATEQYLTRGRELAETDPNEALKYLKSAHDMAPEIAQIPAEIASILLKQNNCDEAIGYLKVALERSPEDLAVKQQVADCMVVLEDYQQAKLLYEELIMEKSGDSSIRQKLEDVKKKIFVQNLPADYQSIPYTAEITRSQLAAYLCIQLEMLQKYRSEQQQIVVDIINHWTQQYVQKVVNLGIMDVYPNRTFQPNQPVTKLELGKAISRIMEIVELSGSVKFARDSNIEIPDIPEHHLYYRLVSRPVAAQVIELDADGRFHPSRRVSGAETISVINKLKALMESL